MMLTTLKPLVPITLKPRFSFNIPHHHVRFRKSPLNDRFSLKTYARTGGSDSAKESSGDSTGPKKDRFGGLNLRWGDLLNPDPDNFVAVGLGAVLTWASLQVLSQLFFISFAILVAALKYSFIAALLIFILVTLL